MKSIEGMGSEMKKLTTVPGRWDQALFCAIEIVLELPDDDTVGRIAPHAHARLHVEGIEELFQVADGNIHAVNSQTVRVNLGAAQHLFLGDVGSPYVGIA